MREYPRAPIVGMQYNRVIRKETPMEASRRSFMTAGALLLSGCATTGGITGASMQAARSELAPTGKLRAAINYNNPVLAVRGADGQPQGVSVDLAREAARRLGVAIELITFTGAGLVVDALRDRKVDLGFVATDPVRGVDVDYTAPYVVIEGAYLVRNDSPLRANEEVDKPGTRIVVGRGSAYDLFLTREIKRATVVRIEGSPRVVEEFIAQKADVAAGVKQQLEADAKRVNGVRLLPGRFMVIEQAMGVPKGRTAAQAWLSAYIEEMKASGYVAQALQRHRIEGAAVAPLRRA
jgi:polar amino acid transport system substrate-binding protein